MGGNIPTPADFYKNSGAATGAAPFGEVEIIENLQPMNSSLYSFKIYERYCAYSCSEEIE